MNRLLQFALKAIIVVAVPIVAIVIPVRILMHPRSVLFEYGRPDFPPDFYGFTLQERTQLAITGIDSIIGPRGVVVLQEARFADGAPAFTEREISHMQDVRVLTQRIYAAQVILFVAAVAAIVILARQRSTRRAAPDALLTGSIVTVALLLALVIFVFAGFDTFFTDFHRLFFSGDSWLFLNTDTLIRLYPPQFWFDAATAIGLASMVEAAALGAVAWWWRRRYLLEAPA